MGWCSTRFVFLFLALAAPAIAQTPAAEISGGWSLLVDEFHNHSLGFQLGAGWRITDSLALVGDLGWNRSTERLPQFKLQQSVTTFSGGPRFYFGKRVTGFTHVLVGVVRANRTASEPGVDLGLGPGFGGFYDPRFFALPMERSESAFMIQPGGGVDLHVSERFAVRLQGDYQWFNKAFFSPPDGDGSGWNLRFVAGGVFYLGRD